MGFLNYGNLSADIVVEKEYHDDYYKEDPPPGQQPTLTKDLPHIPETQTLSRVPEYDGYNEDESESDEDMSQPERPNIPRLVASTKKVDTQVKHSMGNTFTLLATQGYT